MGIYYKLFSKPSSVRSESKRPRSLRYYLLSSRYHAQIGKYATKSYFQFKSFLSKEINLSHSKTSIKELAKAKRKSESKHSQTTQDIRALTKRSNEVLASATTVFPLTLFPDTVVLDRTKVTITQRNFFMSSKVISIRIEDVLNVSADVGPFFGSITIASRVLSSEDHFSINYFRRGDAIHLKHMIQGYVIAQHNKIDVAHLSQDELIETLAELGHDLNT
ncbi:hypothetical protein HZB74_03755 [Candidatus Saccharibacteria bacterium]|nr:hypothetical protein [Candidatus Saccharibacteria bacterium]